MDAEIIHALNISCCTYEMLSIHTQFSYTFINTGKYCNSWMKLKPSISNDRASEN